MGTLPVIAVMGAAFATAMNSTPTKPTAPVLRWFEPEDCPEPLDPVAAVEPLVARVAGFATLDADARQALVAELAAAFAWYENRIHDRTRERGAPEPLALGSPAWLEHDDPIPQDIVARYGIPAEPVPARVNGVHAGRDGLWRRLFGSLGSRKPAAATRDG